MPYKDPEVRRAKQAEYSKKHYEKNKAAIIQKINTKKRANRKWFREYKATLSCISCGENHPSTLDFHHVEPRKGDRKVNKLVSEGHNKLTIKREIAKCVVLCSNCHRKHHFEERIARTLAKKMQKKAKKA